MHIASLIPVLPVDKAIKLYVHTLQKYIPNQWLFNERQLTDFYMAYMTEEYAWQRCRGGSKTRDATALMVFAMLRNEMCIWRASAMDQIDFAKKYFSFNPFVKKVKQYEVVTINGETMSLKSLTDKTARSRRADRLYLDELGSMKHRKDWDNYVALLGTLSGSSNFRILYGSTPTIGSVHDKILRGFDELPGLEVRDLVSWMPHTECPWVDGDAMRSKYPTQWQFDLEMNAIWASPGGAIFPTLKSTDKDSWVIHPESKYYGGIDFNSRQGHAYVEVAIYKNDLHVLKEFTFLDDDMEEATVDTIDYVKSRRSNKVSVEVEDGGHNDGFALRFGKICRKQRWTREVKSQRLIGKKGLTQYNIHISQKHTPRLYKNMVEAAWDEEHPSEFVLDKDADQHYLDALMHCVHGRGSTGIQVFEGALSNQPRRSRGYRTPEGHYIKR